MNFFKTSILSAFRTFITMLSNLAVNKLMAVFVGAEGFTVLGQFKDLLQAGIGISQLGFQNGIVKEVSQHKKNIEKLKSTLSSALKSQILISLIFGVILILFKDDISIYLIGNSDFSFILPFIGIGILPQAIFSTIMATLNGLKEFRRYVIISVLMSLANALINSLLIYFLGLDGALYGMAVNLFISIAIILFFQKNSSLDIKWFFGKFSMKAFKNLLQYSYMFLSGILSLSICLIIVRKHLIKDFGVEYAGYWEALWRISKVYVTFLISTFSLYILPTFSEISVKYLKKEIFKIWRITIPLSIIASLLIFLLKDLIITLIYTKEFLVISSIIAFQLIGDTIKLNSMVLGNVLIAKAHTVTFIAVQLGWALIFYIGVKFFTTLYGFQGVTIAYLASYILHFLFMNLYFRKLIWRK